MKIVVLDGYSLNPGDLSWEGLTDLGEYSVHDRTSKKELLPRMKDADIVLTNKTPLTRETIEACPHLKYIGVLATGYNVVDLDAAKERGIVVTNVPTYGTDAVAQFTIALLLEICHHIGLHDHIVHKGKWSKVADFSFWETPLMELSGKALGLVGFGRIGQRVAAIAEALGMNVMVHTKTQREPNVAYVSLDMLLEKSDVISLHCPLTPETHHLINKDTIAQMKDGVILLNTARGDLIQEEDLATALYKGKVGYAGLDVLSQEPPTPHNPLLFAPNCIITPHIAWAPRESRRRLMDMAIQNIRLFLEDRPENVVSK